MNRQHFILALCIGGMVWASVVHAANNKATLLAGTGIVDITPDVDVPLAGPIGGSGKATKVHDRLHVRALAIRNGDTRLVLCVADSTIISSELHHRIRDLVYRQTGLPENHLLVSATHTHNSPRALPLDLGPAHRRYQNRLAQWVAEAVEQAFGHLEPARIGWGSVDQPEHCRNRRWLMKPGTLGPNPFGEKTDQVKMYGGPGEHGLRAVGPTDPELFILSAQRPDGSQIGLFANFSIHYGAGAPGGGVSADYFGHFSREAGQLLGATTKNPVVAIMSNGTSGDVAPGGNPLKLGKSLAVAAVKVIRGIRHREHLPIAVRETELSLQVRRPDAQRLAWARAVQAGTWKQPAHPWKDIYARNALWLKDYPEEVPVRLQVIRLGDLAITAMPCEVYAETGLSIKARSPFASTFNVGLANGYNGYLPTPGQHRLGGYTTWPAISSPLATDSEPKIRAEVVRLLSAVADQH